MILLRVISQLESVAFAPDGRGLAAAGRGGLFGWADVTAGGPPTWSLDRPALAVVYVAGGQAALVAADWAGLWHVAIPSAEARHLGYLACGKLAVSADGTFAAVHDGHTARLSGWVVGPTAAECRWTLESVGMGYSSGPAVAPDGRTVIGPDPNPQAAVPLPMVVWDAATGERREAVPMPAGASTAVAVHPDGVTVAFGSAGKLVVGSVTAGGPPARVVPTGERKYLTHVAFHPSGRWLAAASNDRTVRFYDTASWAVAKTFAWNAGRVRCLAFSPDGTLAAAGTHTGRVVVWDVDE